MARVEIDKVGVTRSPPTATRRFGPPAVAQGLPVKTWLLVVKTKHMLRDLFRVDSQGTAFCAPPSL